MFSTRGPLSPDPGIIIVCRAACQARKSSPIAIGRGEFDGAVLSDGCVRPSRWCGLDIDLFQGGAGRLWSVDRLGVGCGEHAEVYDGEWIGSVDVRPG